MSPSRPTLRCVTFDAMGTLVELDRPVGRLREELRARGVAVTLEDAQRALRAEMAYYREHHHTARDEASLARLRRRCAGELGAALPADAVLPPAELLAALLAALRFVPTPHAQIALRALRGMRLRLVVVSNWDVSLHGVLADLDLAAHFDAVLTSAEEGVAKPGAEIFHRALAGEDPARALHVGDSLPDDVQGALGAGMRAALVVRRGPFPVLPPGVNGVRSLLAVAGMVGPGS